MSWVEEQHKRQIKELQDRVATLDALVLALAEKLWIVAQHLAKLSEREEVRGR